MKNRSHENIRLQGGLILMALLFPLLAFPGIPEPPMVLLGKLETPGGLQVTSGDLQFRFTPTGGGTAVSIDATVGSFGSGYSFYAIIPLESAISGTVSPGVLNTMERPPIPRASATKEARLPPVSPVPSHPSARGFWN
jgi:hypothetical protein